MPLGDVGVGGWWEHTSSSRSTFANTAVPHLCQELSQAWRSPPQPLFFCTKFPGKCVRTSEPCINIHVCFFCGIVCTQPDYAKRTRFIMHNSSIMYMPPLKKNNNSVYNSSRSLPLCRLVTKTILSPGVCVEPARGPTFSSPEDDEPMSGLVNLQPIRGPLCSGRS